MGEKVPRRYHLRPFGTIGCWACLVRAWRVLARFLACLTKLQVTRRGNPRPYKVSKGPSLRSRDLPVPSRDLEGSG